MKKIIYYLILLLFFILITFTIIISTIGINTDRFNDLIIKKINQTNSNINLKLSTIKFKLDVKEISLFIETINPQINYRKIDVPAKKIKDRFSKEEDKKKHLSMLEKCYTDLGFNDEMLCTNLFN